MTNNTQALTISSALSSGAPTMSSREIAELTGKRHDHVIRDIDKMLDENEIDRPKFGGVYRDAKGEERKCYNLPQDLTYTLVAGYRSDLRLKIVRRWMELETSIAPAPAKRTRKPAFDVAFQRLLTVAKALPDMTEKQGAVMAARGTEKLTGVNPLELMGISYLDDPDPIADPVSGYYPSDEDLLIKMAKCDNWEKQAHYLVQRGHSCEQQILKAYELIAEVKEMVGLNPIVERVRKNFLDARKAVPMPRLRKVSSPLVKPPRRKRISA